MTTEIWKPVPGYEGYEASSIGRIRGLDRISPVTGRPIRAKIMTPTPDRKGYLSVTLAHNRRKLAHILVTLAFHGEPPSPTHQVNHINGVKADNRPENLEWVTPRENLRHARDVLGKTFNHPGAGNYNARLTGEQVRAIRARYVPRKVTLQALAIEYDVNAGTIYCIVANETWTEAQYY